MFYEPVQSNRFFESERLYSEVDWSNFAEVVDAFGRRMTGWYIEPAEALIKASYYNQFSSMSIVCLLIDALSQYRFGMLASQGMQFKQFVKRFLPNYSKNLPQSIWHYDHGHGKKGKELFDYADILWHGIRCGILHEAHAPLYCGLSPGPVPPVIRTNQAMYSSGVDPTLNGSECPTIVLSSEHLLGEVKVFFNGYLHSLKNKAPQNDELRANFKKKFTESFGIDLDTSSLP